MVCLCLKYRQTDDESSIETHKLLVWTSVFKCLLPPMSTPLLLSGTRNLMTQPATPDNSSILSKEQKVTAVGRMVGIFP